MTPLDTGRYFITNCKYKNFAVLHDAEQYSDIVAGNRENDLGEMWNIDLLSSGTYKIQNYGHGSFANGENGFWAKPGDGIVGGTHPQQWRIMEMPSKGDYCICPAANMEVCWSLADGEPNSPIVLGYPLTSRQNQWTLTRVSDGHIVETQSPSTTLPPSTPDHTSSVLIQKCQSVIEINRLAEAKHKTEGKVTEVEMKERMMKEEMQRAKEIERKARTEQLANKAEERRKAEIEIKRKVKLEGKGRDKAKLGGLQEEGQSLAENGRKTEEQCQAEPERKSSNVGAKRTEERCQAEIGAERLSEANDKAESEAKRLEAKMKERTVSEDVRRAEEADRNALKEQLANKAERRRRGAIELRRKVELEAKRREDKAILTASDDEQMVDESHQVNEQRPDELEKKRRFKATLRTLEDMYIGEVSGRPWKEEQLAGESRQAELEKKAPEEQLAEERRCADERSKEENEAKCKTKLERALKEQQAEERRDADIEAKCKAELQAKALDDQTTKERQHIEERRNTEAKHKTEIETQRKYYEAKLRVMEEKIRKVEESGQKALKELASEKENQRTMEEKRLAENAERKALEPLAQDTLQAELEMKSDDEAKQKNLDERRREAEQQTAEMEEKYKAEKFKHEVGQRETVLGKQEEFELLKLEGSANNGGRKSRSSSWPKTRPWYSKKGWKKTKLWGSKARSSGPIMT